MSVDNSCPAVTQQPGYYLKMDPKATGSGRCALNLNAGLYVLADFSSTSNVDIQILGSGPTTIVLLNGMSIGNNNTMSGQNVMFYNACKQFYSRTPHSCLPTDPTSDFGSITIYNNTVSTITPPSSGIYKNMLFFQDRLNTSTISLQNNGGLGTGTIYAATAEVDLLNNSNMPLQIIADSIFLKNGANISDTATSDQVAYHNPTVKLIL
jgi:hypothetical protein